MTTFIASERAGAAGLCLDEYIRSTGLGVDNLSQQIARGPGVRLLNPGTLPIIAAPWSALRPETSLDMKTSQRKMTIVDGAPAPASTIGGEPGWSDISADPDERVITVV